MENYFNYFTEIEEAFQRRRGGTLLLSTLDWALIETWKDAGIPLEAAMRGIDAAFDKYDQKPSKSRKVNSLAYCAQEVLSSAEEMKEAVVGVSNETADVTSRPSGFDSSEIIAFLRRNAASLKSSHLPEKAGIAAQTIAGDVASTLLELADKLEAAPSQRLEDLERHLTILEEKLFTVLMTVTPDSQLVQVRGEADRALSPYRSKVPSGQAEQLQKQFLNKRLLEMYGLSRLSLFYM